MIEQNEAGVVPAERRLGSIDDRPGFERVGRGDDHRAEDALQEVLGDHRRAGQRQRLVQQSHGRGTRRLRRRAPRRGVATSAPRPPAIRGRGAGRPPRSARPPRARGRRTATRPRRSAPTRTPRRAARRCACAVACRSRADLDDLRVGRRPVEQELGGAEVAVEDGVGDLGVLPGAPQLEPHAVEPVARRGGRAVPAARRGRAPSSRGSPASTSRCGLVARGLRRRRSRR